MSCDETAVLAYMLMTNSINIQSLVGRQPGVSPAPLTGSLGQLWFNRTKIKTRHKFVFNFYFTNFAIAQ